MKKMLFLMIVLSNVLQASDQAEEVEIWFKETLKKRMTESGKFDLSEIKAKNEEILSKSVPCKTSANTQEDYSIYLMMTFDLPESIWMEYSSVLEKIGGSFVVRGLPNDSFLEFAKTVKKLRDRGIKAPIQLNPKLFERLSIDRAPSVVLIDGEKYDKISGTISISYALDQFEKSGETRSAATLQAQLSGGLN
jgi:conjugal transfer pilus assembly protein TrbC